MDVSWDQARDTLREWRDTNVRDSESVVEYGENLIRNYASKLSDELWLVCEQVYIAALDINYYDLADLCLNKLEKNFPNSIRVQKLNAMKHEAKGNYEKALEIYDELEKSDPTDAAVKKRKIAITKNVDRNSAIKQLTVYLNTFVADHDAWMELADLYIEQMDYGKAAFCLEELILSNTFNHLYHQRYAEIRYSQGGDENYKIARQYFAQAIKLSSNSNIRALYGLMLASSKLCKPSNKDGNNKQYANWAAKVISQKYKEVHKNQASGDQNVPNELIASVNQTLGELNLTDS